MSTPVLIVSPGDLRRIRFWLACGHSWDVDVDKGTVYVPGVGDVAMSVLQVIKLGVLVWVSGEHDDDDDRSDYGG